MKFTGGEYLQRGRGLGGLLRLAKSVFSPIVRTVAKAAKNIYEFMPTFKFLNFTTNMSNDSYNRLIRIVVQC